VFQQMLLSGWRSSRWVLAPFAVAALGLPLLAMRTAGTAAREIYAPGQAVLMVMEVWAPLFPALAALLGIAVALAMWSWDHGGRHVYALSLPLPRWRYVLMKMGAGAALIGLPVGLFWIGSLMGVWSVDLPEGVRAYPLALGLRFLLATAIAYAAAFALAAGTKRTVTWLLIGLLVFVVGGSLIVDVIQPLLGVDGLPTPLDLLDAALIDWPGPFHVFGGNWMLVDV